VHEPLPPDFWKHPSMQAARATRDMGAVIRAYRHHPHFRRPDGHPLRQEVVALQVGLSQVQVSRIEKGTNQVRDLGKLIHWARSLAMPSSFAWFELPDDPPRSQLAASRPPGNVDGAVRTVEEDDVKRRTALVTPIVMAAAAVSSGSEPWQRLNRAMENPGRLTAGDVDDLERETVDYFRREEHEPARQLAGGLRHHTQRLSRLLDGPAPTQLRPRLLATIGEALALYGWFAFDRNDPANATHFYGLAERAARDAEDGPLRACILAYRSYLAEATGKIPDAVELLVEAQTYVHSSSSAATRAWLAAREAELRARLQQFSGALVALERALTAYDYARPQHERAWTAFFTSTRLGSMTVTTYTHLNHPELSQTANSLVGALGAGDAKIKAVILADLATAAIHDGDHDQAAAMGNGALTLTNSHEVSIGADRLRAFRALIAQHPDSRALVELDERIVHELSWHRRQ
jgi:transcriptional regulator with XRE-family HTH domain